MPRIPIELTADTECAYCAGAGLRTTSLESSDFTFCWCVGNRLHSPPHVLTRKAFAKADVIADALAKASGCRRGAGRPDPNEPPDEPDLCIGYQFVSEHGTEFLVCIPRDAVLANIKKYNLRIEIDGNEWDWKYAVDILRDEDED